MSVAVQYERPIGVSSWSTSWFLKALCCILYLESPPSPLLDSTTLSFGLGRITLFSVHLNGRKSLAFGNKSRDFFLSKLHSEKEGDSKNLHFA